MYNIPPVFSKSFLNYIFLMQYFYLEWSISPLLHFLYYSGKGYEYFSNIAEIGLTSAVLELERPKDTFVEDL